MAEQTCLKIGDVISKVEGKPLAEVIKARLPYYPASNLSTQMRDLALDILRANSNNLNINYIRKGKEFDLQLKLYKKSELDYYRGYRRDLGGESFKLLDNNIGYVTLKNIRKEDIPSIKRQFFNTKGVIIDIRNYPNTSVLYALVPFFTNKRMPFAKFTLPSINNPGEFIMSKPLKVSGPKKVYLGKLVVLVNEWTQSESEFTTMALQTGRDTTVLGSTTAAADGNVTTIMLPGNLRTRISGVGIYYPDGRETQGIGIVPDIEVLPTINGIKANQDEQLEAAIKFISQ
jgi:C-terminal processing protease CtpA/Prc